jgi:hypothetical protein
MPFTSLTDEEGNELPTACLPTIQLVPAASTYIEVFVKPTLSLQKG